MNKESKRIKMSSKSNISPQSFHFVGDPCILQRDRAPRHKKCSQSRSEVIALKFPLRNSSQSSKSSWRSRKFRIVQDQLRAPIKQQLMLTGQHGRTNYRGFQEKGSIWEKLPLWIINLINLPVKYERLINILINLSWKTWTKICITAKKSL